MARDRDLDRDALALLAAEREQHRRALLARVEARLEVVEMLLRLPGDQVQERLLDQGDRRGADQGLRGRVQVGEAAGLEIEGEVGVADPVDRGAHPPAAVQGSAPAAALLALRLGGVHQAADPGAEAGLEHAHRDLDLVRGAAQTSHVYGHLDGLLERQRVVSAQAIERRPGRTRVDGRQPDVAAEAAHDLESRRWRRLRPTDAAVHLVLDGAPEPVQEPDRLPQDRRVHLRHPPNRIQNSGRLDHPSAPD